MKTLLFLFFIGFPGFLFGQTLSEDFEDGNFTSNPTWTGDTGEFTVFDDSGNNLLRLNDTDQSNSSTQLRTSSTAAYGTWEFFVRMDFNPSSSNYTDIYLVSDQANLQADLNGYFIRIGDSSDEISLFRQDGSSSTKIIDGPDGTVSNDPVEITVKAVRDSSGNWEVFIFNSVTRDFESQGSIQDNTHHSSAYFGLVTHYTSTRSDRFYFDDIHINIFKVNEVIPYSNQMVEVNFNFPTDASTVSTTDFSLSGGWGAPQQIQLVDSNLTARLNYETDLPNNDYTLTVNDISDAYGNWIETDSEINFSFTNPFKLLSVASAQDNRALLTFTESINFSTVNTSDFTMNNEPIDASTVISQPESDQILLTFSDTLPSGLVEISVSNIESATGWSLPSESSGTLFIYDDYQSGDIVINEFLKDPPAGTEEYVELRNVSSRYLNLKDWQVGDENSLTLISDSDFTVFPDSFVVISADTSILSSFYGPAYYMQASLPALNNSSDQIRVYNENGSLIDSLSYDSDWDGVDIALERRDAAAPATFKENWGDSPDPSFGTPGSTNKISPDEKPPEILDLIVQDEQSLLLILSERLETNTAEIPANYSLSQNPEPEATAPPLPSIVSSTQVAADTILLQLNVALEEYDGNWTLEAENLTDIFGNTTSSSVDFNYYMIFTAEKNQVAINEFMYDPATGFSEFVELYNKSDSSFNLKDWSLNDNTGNQEPVSVSNFVLPRGEFVILAPDSALVDLFPEVNLIVMGSRFPALNNGTDAIAIRNQYGALIDSLTYTSEWGGDEISLERRSVDYTSAFKENWGNTPSERLATPGTANAIEADTTPPSLFILEQTADDQLLLIFSERLQQEPAEDISNFALSADNLDQIPTLQSVILSAPDTILLQFETKLPSLASGTVYELSITGQSDIFDNHSDEIRQTFFVIEYAKADSGEVFITEFMYDPAEGFSDFIELYNATENAVNLQGWTYNDGSGNPRIISDQELPLLPDARMIIAPDSSVASLFPETDLVDMGSRFANLNSTTPDDIVIRRADSTLIDSLSYQTSWGGEEISLERRTIEISGTYQENWGNSPSQYLATPGQPNQIPMDERPPALKDLTVFNDSTLRIIFDERIKHDQATDPENYFFIIPLNFEGSVPDILSIDFFAPDTVILNFPRKLPREENGSSLLLTIANQTDIFGNVADYIEEEIFLIDLSEAQTGDVVINEFLYDPEDELTEFVELFNHTDRNFDLKEWMLNDNTGNRRMISDTTYELATGSYVVLAPDSSLTELFPMRNTIVMGSRFPSLNNSTDAIVISNADSVIIDSLSYSSDWGGEGVSLERLNPNASSLYKENWADSPVSTGATPGLQNQVVPDEDPPKILSAAPISADSIRINFSERIDSTLAYALNSYTISPTINISEIARYSGDHLYLVLGETLSDGTTYTVTIQDQQDIFGNLMKSAKASFEYILLSEAQPKSIVINEILYRRASASSEEFVELYNRTEHNFDLSGWTFSDATGSTEIPTGTQIRGGAFVIFTDLNPESESNTLQVKQPSSVQLNSGTVYLPGFPSLNDDEDAVVIKNPEGVIIDSLFYNETWGGNEPGRSLERKDPESPSNDGSNWATSTAASGNSAGNKSSVFQPDETPPEVIFAKLRPDGKILVAFSEFITIENTGVLVNDEPVAITGYDETKGNVLVLGEDTFQTGEPLQLSFDNVQDFRGNTSENLHVEVSQPLAPGKVVINEILYNPLANSDDNLPDQTEYIELYNGSEYAISLEGFYLHDEPDENQDIRDIQPVSSQFKWIPAGKYALIYAEDQAATFSESRLATYFEMTKEDDRFYIRADRSNLSLANSDDAIFVADSTGTTIDSVFFDESWQNPNLHDTDGIALERIDPNGPSNDASNWSSSTRVNGGTPGEQNSIFQSSGIGPEDTGISFSPNPFSPDDDGFDDNLFINYKLEEPDYLLHVRIFDRYGREVRELADGKQAGFEGSLIWDGLTDNNRKNRVGIYIVLFEAYNSANGKNKTFKETVVLARKF
ncbi:lamin tail domain-containing protein [Gracilimonas tropica]|uniref:lamin tail domain-containing protein n=1 Tax=Gracilimonas tropica TaxID=454600 RepID=UPI00035EFF1F|nr:lamin tail domain-containing protein [Gracilimonas tropica]